MWRGRPGARTAWFGRWSPARFRFKEEEGCGPQLSVAQGGGLASRYRGLPRAGPAVSAQEGGRSQAGLLARWARSQAERGFPFFFLFFKLLNPFSNRFEFLLNFWIKANHHNKKYAPA